MIAPITRLAAIAAFAALSACAAITLAPAGAYVVGDSAVTLDRNWSDASAAVIGRSKKVRLLTIDGPLLNRLYLTEGLVEGDYLVRPAQREGDTPVYRTDMSITEQVEFVADSVTALGYQRVETAGVRPVDIQGRRGVRFDIEAQTAEGLDVRGLGQAFKQGDELYVAIYVAPAEHYYEATLTSAEQAMSSLTL
ncbi:MAG: hypothetical protein V7678_03640 [Brevundimonas sp.]